MNDAGSLGAPSRAAQSIEGKRIAETHTFVTHDGTELFYRHWPAARPGDRRRGIVLFHRGHEHSGRLQHVVDELALETIDMFAWDARGHGRSPGERGDSPSFGASVKDIDRFVRHIAQVHDIPSTELAIVAQSMAAVLVATWVHDYAPRVRCLAFTSPAFKVKLYVPFARAGLGLMYRLRGNFFVTSYVKARFLTHDPERMRSYDEDPLIARAISVRILLGLYEAAERIVADAQSIRAPLLLLVSDTDWVVHRGPQEAFFDRLGSKIKEKHVLPNFLHDTLGEKDRHLAIDRIRDFVLRMFEGECAADSQRKAHREGHAYDEEQSLRRPLPALSPRNLNFALTRLSMRTLGRLSSGIRLGLATGFDSGASLDYVYRNQAEGRLGLGKLIDRGYLDAIGWRGVRIRREHLRTAIATAADRLKTHGKPIRFADMASGPGRYVLDALAEAGVQPEAILLRDIVEANVLACRKEIEQRDLRSIARCERADAFDPASVAALDPAPTLTLVSGLYELFSDNARVSTSLAAIGRAMAPGSCLVYTGQPWHPQLELIARTLTSHRDGQPWIMRRRSQAELDELVRDAGFEKLEQWIDAWGMFTVSLAVRTDAGS
jgi:alpha-beta hydrolase superfamily lysophospholipase